MVAWRIFILPVVKAARFAPVLASWLCLQAGVWLLTGPAPAFAADRVAGPIAAEVERVVDGDTVRVSAKIWIDQTLSISVRLSGVDAPELFRPSCPAEKEKAREAKAFVENMLGDGAATLEDIHNGKYAGRVVARLVNNQGEDVGAALVSAGLAVPDGASEPWCD